LKPIKETKVSFDYRILRFPSFIHGINPLLDSNSSDNKSMLTLNSPRYNDMKDTLPLLELPEKEHGAGKFLARGFHLCNDHFIQYIRTCKK
jgi:hypothetical protein